MIAWTLSISQPFFFRRVGAGGMIGLQGDRFAVERHVRVSIVFEVRKANATELHMVGTVDGYGWGVGHRRYGSHIIILQHAVTADSQAPHELTPLPAAGRVLVQGRLPGKNTTPFWLAMLYGSWKFLLGLKSA